MKRKHSYSICFQQEWVNSQTTFYFDHIVPENKQSIRRANI